MKTKDIFISDSSIADSYVKKHEYPFEVLPLIKSYILEMQKDLDDNYVDYGDGIYIHNSATISYSAEINGPCIIDANAEIRHNAYIRGNVIIGKNSVLGNSCEIKNSILYDGVQVPHFNYVGDSILGYKSHMGAGSIISNLKSDKKNIVIKYNDEVIDTNMKKIGAFLGDYVEVGCGAVLNPGTIIFHDSNIYPLTSVRGVVQENSIVKSMNEIVKKK